jgi:hypothetical protein
VRDDQDGWVVLKPAEGGAGLSFQREGNHVPPTWPPAPGEQQMQAHLDIGVGDLAAGVQRAQSLGATLASHQPQDDVRVLLAPAVVRAPHGVLDRTLRTCSRPSARAPARS